MKSKILKVASDLENGLITEDKAKQLLLNLFGVAGSLQPLTIERVGTMLLDISLEAFLACGKTEEEWREWYNSRSKVNINSE